MALIQLLSLVLLVSVSKAIWVKLQKKLRAELTALDDIPLLSEPRRDGRRMQGTAVICGGSISGLLSARVCSTHFEKVVIIEPEEWLAGADGVRDRHREISTTEHPVSKRSHVAQYTAVHAYQTFLHLALQKLFPNLQHEVEQEAVGGRIVPYVFKTHLSGIRIPSPHHQYPNGILPKSLFITRPALETSLRRMVLKTCPNVTYSVGNVVGLVRDKSSASMISSVKVRSRSGADEEISSTLVIDCTGPALGGLRWLKDLPPATDTYVSQNSVALEDIKITFDHKMAYTTCEFDVPSSIFEELKKHGSPTNADDLNLYIYAPNPKVESSNVIIHRREKNTLQIACGGWDCRERMTSVSDIRDFLCSKLIPAHPVPAWVLIMLDVFEREEVPATFVYHRCPPAVYVRYHLANGIPSNFVAIGDSVMQTNPIRAVGCTKACVEAVTLNAELTHCVPVSLLGEKDSKDALPPNFSRKYFAKLAKRTAYIWKSAKLSDYAFECTTPIPGENKETTGSWSRAYSASVMRLSMMDADVNGVLYKISNWVAPATDIFSPVILSKVAWMRTKDVLGF